ncbi:SpaA isopeptide-forming pilin-related protein [Pseudobutyrivibrio xylanivorans]|uniref:LPXTG-motif cell wall anchor domain-containing protein n=1 Tax=Pseudobutyrivibrio xylanivorans DSM 14809 TaxID=1123012 RepID=A0A1M6DPP4_PSEXY|nr:SpaA isopeptide-forming pilin-related protein [Pseudobutyrivibrio xylanivorans]SHI75187.1 LPXTG-motif cell wall anchor domain-containing protein [Pseudobutyrivibrio xylanivorans DSM 14809]
MRKAKKLLTLILAITMMFAMSITAFATDSGNDVPAGAKIKVEGVGDNAQLTYAQVIKVDPTKETGWAFTNSSYSSLFTQYGTDEQSMIKGWIAAIDESESTRLSKLGSATVSTTFPNPLEGAAAGLYLIKGTEPGYTFSPMLAYVSPDDAKNGETITVIAKKTPDEIDKELSDKDNDHYVENNKEISYDVNATVPYLPKGGTAELVITDTLTGGVFKRVKEGANQGKVEVQISIESTPRYIEPESDSKLVIDLGDLISEDNENANKELVITYTAICTAEVINNKATMNNDPLTEDEVNSYTGKLKITKYNEANSNNPEKLSGASFVVMNADGQYAVIEDDTLKEWVDEYTEDCYVTTGSDGTATVKGFDPDQKYRFLEVVAPTDYALNTDPVEAEWKVDMPDDQQIAEAEMYDTKLSELPYTGGKGTAAFTGFGVLLMSVAAGLYYSNKKNKTTK